jgi:hypothetical protein
MGSEWQAKGIYAFAEESPVMIVSDISNEYFLERYTKT